MNGYLKILSPEYRKFIPQLFKWELFSPAGPMNSFSFQRKVRRKIQEKYTALYPKNSIGYYSRYDWMRLELSLPFCKGPKILEVGPYNGAFVDMLKLWDKSAQITALDIAQHPSWTSPEGVELVINDVTQMNFPENSFNTVSAQEIIEHLPIESVEPALKKIRSVANDRLIASLPFKETYPLHKQDHPSGHKQSFDEEKIMRLFPHAYFFQAEAGLGAPWIIIIEDFAKPSTHNEFKLHTPDEILRIINAT
ncbi:MAG: class I SAM-dependent methyltransferase [Bdellovibrionales bacterium]|nr:class I SAM-dependent methyltransferase [Bdellovibrionales bacterium]